MGFFINTRRKKDYDVSNGGLIDAAKDGALKRKDFPINNFVQKINEYCLGLLKTSSEENKSKIKIGDREYVVNTNDFKRKLKKISPLLEEGLKGLTKNNYIKRSDFEFLAGKMIEGAKELLILYLVEKSLDLPVEAIENSKHDLKNRRDHVISHYSGVSKNTDHQWGNKNDPHNKAVNRFLINFEKTLNKTIDQKKSYKSGQNSNFEIKENDAYLEKYDLSVEGLINAIQLGDFENDDFPISHFSGLLGKDENDFRLLLCAAKLGDDGEGAIKKLVENGATLSVKHHFYCKTEFRNSSAGWTLENEIHQNRASESVKKQKEKNLKRGFSVGTPDGGYNSDDVDKKFPALKYLDDARNKYKSLEEVGGEKPNSGEIPTNSPKTKNDRVTNLDDKLAVQNHQQ